MFADGEKCFIEVDDLCNTCQYAKNTIDCPLVQAVGYGHLYMSDEGFVVSNCKLYKQTKMKLISIENTEQKVIKEKKTKKENPFKLVD